MRQHFVAGGGHADSQSTCPDSGNAVEERLKLLGLRNQQLLDLNRAMGFAAYTQRISFMQYGYLAPPTASTFLCGLEGARCIPSHLVYLGAS